VPQSAGVPQSPGETAEAARQRPVARASGTIIP